MKDDVSKKTLIVLVLLVIIVTVFGTWAALSTTAPQRIIRTVGQAQGVVLLGIAESTPPAVPQNSSGQITLGIAG